jgi:hypothetical protein
MCRAGLRKWKFVFEDLRSWSIQSVPAAEAAAQVDSGRAVLLDVREGSKFAQGCATGSVNVPLYTSGIKGTTGWDKLRCVRPACHISVTLKRHSPLSLSVPGSAPMNHS